MNAFTRRVLVFLASFAATAALATDLGTLRLATTTSTDNSGLLRIILPKFEQASGLKVHVISVGTGKAMKLGENGDVDVVLVHSRPDEDKFVAAGYGVERRDVMYNDFIVVGPPADPAKMRGMRDVLAAFRRLLDSDATFVSRGDDSGTHKKELELWAAAGGLRAWPGYVSSGQGTSQALGMAYELDAYDLVDRATLRQLSARYPLPILVEGDPRLLNEYGVTTLKPAPGRAVRTREADAFARWIVSEAARKLIAGYRVRGERAFRLPGEPRPAR